MGYWAYIDPFQCDIESRLDEEGTADFSGILEPAVLLYAHSGARSRFATAVLRNSSGTESKSALDVARQSPRSGKALRMQPFFRAKQQTRRGITRPGALQLQIHLRFQAVGTEILHAHPHRGRWLRARSGALRRTALYRHKARHHRTSYAFRSSTASSQGTARIRESAIGPHPQTVWRLNLQSPGSATQTNLKKRTHQPPFRNLWKNWPIPPRQNTPTANEPPP